MKINSERLILTPIAQNDFEAIHEMNSYHQVGQYNTIGIPKDISETTAFLQKLLEDTRDFVWVIREKASLEFVGTMGLKLSPEKYRKGEVHYNLHPDFWGNGYATEALKTVISFGFSELGLHRMEAGVAVENTRSINVLERAGMTREGVCRKILPLESGWMDNYMYAILEEDPRNY